MKRPQRPNILLFCVDQFQSYCLGCNGHPAVKTPNLDRLAAQGVTFRRAYCNNPVCMPSRATIFTGQTPRHHGLLTNGCKLSTDIPTVVQAMADVGYRTHSVGKLHLQPSLAKNGEAGATSCESKSTLQDPDYEFPRPYYGFQSVDYVGGHGAGNHGQYKHWLDAQDPKWHKRYALANAYHRAGDRSHGFRIDLPEELHYNHWIADRTNQFIVEQDASQPFFTWCSFPDPHFPFAACRPYSEMYDPADMELPATWQQREDLLPVLNEARDSRNFRKPPTEEELREVMAQTYGMITHIDTCIGRVLKTLDEQGLAESTAIGFIADHGEYLGAHGLVYKDMFPWEELWRIPMIWHLPWGDPESHHEDQVVSLLDVAPTLANLSGLDPNWHDTRGVAPGPKAGLPGRSLVNRVECAEPLATKPAIVEFDSDGMEDMPLCRMRGLVADQYKLAIWPGHDECGLLIDLANDPHETINLWHDPSHAVVRHDMTLQLLQQLTLSDRYDTRRWGGA